MVLTNKATNRRYGASPSTTLTVDDKILGAGQLGLGELTLFVAAGGLIEGDDALALTLDTGAATIFNDGTIASAGTGGVTVASAINNTGTLEALGGILTINGPVSGRGTVKITAGTADFASTFSENVTFAAGAVGILELAHAQGYTGSITTFSKTGGTSLDLVDIGFVNSGEAPFSGTKTSGVLTVTDGTHTAHITLKGNYTTSTFVASSDGHGGTIVIDPKSKGPITPAHQFIAAMAGLGAGGGSVTQASEAWRTTRLALAAPRAQVA